MQSSRIKVAHKNIVSMHYIMYLQSIQNILHLWLTGICCKGNRHLSDLLRKLFKAKEQYKIYYFIYVHNITHTHITLYICSKTLKYRKLFSMIQNNLILTKFIFQLYNLFPEAAYICFGITSKMKIT